MCVRAQTKEEGVKGNEWKGTVRYIQMCTLESLVYTGREIIFAPIHYFYHLLVLTGEHWTLGTNDPKGILTYPFVGNSSMFTLQVWAICILAHFNLSLLLMWRRRRWRLRRRDRRLELVAFNLMHVNRQSNYEITESLNCINLVERTWRLKRRMWRTVCCVMCIRAQKTVQSTSNVNENDSQVLTGPKRNANCGMKNEKIRKQKKIKNENCLTHFRDG